jgi:hypothetical protein
MLDTNKILNVLLYKDSNQENGETIFLIWYQVELAIPTVIPTMIGSKSKMKKL